MKKPILFNSQTAEKAKLDPEGCLEVHSVFFTIQGEGPFTGQRAIFVRLAGCNLQCPLCDTEYTTGRYTHSVTSLMDVVNEMGMWKINNRGTLVVITGGEPLRQNLSPFIHALIDTGYRVQIETNGTLYQELPYDNITVICSPKTGSVNKNLQPHIWALKYVLSADDYCENDGLPLHALEHTATPKLARPWPTFFGKIYLQPLDEQNPVNNARHLEAVKKSVMKHGYILQLQIHKLIEME
jgi:organic radical activating enzyme